MCRTVMWFQFYFNNDICFVIPHSGNLLSVRTDTTNALLRDQHFSALRLFSGSKVNLFVLHKMNWILLPCCCCFVPRSCFSHARRDVGPVQYFRLILLKLSLTCRMLQGMYSQRISPPPGFDTFRKMICLFSSLFMFHEIIVDPTSLWVCPENCYYYYWLKERRGWSS
jgi:hypothetical protein